METHVHTKPCTLMFTAVLFITAQRGTQLTCSSPDEWISKTGSVDTMEDELAIKREEILVYATARRTLENTMLSETSRSALTTYDVIPFIQNVRNGGIHRDQK